jgi:hypothetical protein
MAVNGTFVNPNNVTCQRYSMRSGLNIPDVAWFAFPGEIENPPMAACCNTSSVNLVDGCYLWCAVPPEFTVGKIQDLTDQSLGEAFNACLESKGATVGGYSANIGKSFRDAKAKNGAGRASGGGAGRVLAVLGVVWLLLV